jgi:hypothetical protein
VRLHLLDDLAGRRLGADRLTGAEALQKARALARAELPAIERRNEQRLGAAVRRSDRSGRHKAGDAARRSQVHHSATEERALRAGMASCDGSAILVAERGGRTMFARIRVMRALNRHYFAELNPKSNERHWSRRKLKRDK